VSIDEIAASRLDAMITKAGDVQATYKAPGSGSFGPGWIDVGSFAEWRAQSLVLLSQALGAQHQYTRSFADSTTKSSLSSTKTGLGVLRAAAEDLRNGFLFEARALIEAEVFADFLEMADHLVSQGYKDPAASLAGSVLEDGLRRIADKHSLTWTKSDGLASLNTELAKAGVYNKLTSTKIDGWRLTRNNADHGHFSEYTEDDVHQMVSGVRDLLEAHLT
jgi:hypothetical protein